VLSAGQISRGSIGIGSISWLAETRPYTCLESQPPAPGEREVGRGFVQWAHLASLRGTTPSPGPEEDHVIPRGVKRPEVDLPGRVAQQPIQAATQLVSGGLFRPGSVAGPEQQSQRRQVVNSTAVAGRRPAGLARAPRRNHPNPQLSRQSEAAAAGGYVEQGGRRTAPGESRVVARSGAAMDHDQARQRPGGG
jgi:hypothetical protein